MKTHLKTTKRSLLAKLLVNAFDLKMKGEVKGFKDVSPSDWSYKYIQILVSNGITKGSFRTILFLANNSLYF